MALVLLNGFSVENSNLLNRKYITKHLFSSVKTVEKSYNNLKEEVKDAE